MDQYARVSEAAVALRDRLPEVPSVAVVLGSGMGAFASRPADAISIRYGDLPHWPPAAVIGHEGQLVIGRLGRQTVAVLSGRSHYYEGHDWRTVTFATRVMGLLGVKVLILTNAAGAVNAAFVPGSFMIIDDHLNLMGSNPLIGPNDDRFGLRFPDMSEVYSRPLRQVADEAAAALGIPVVHGVYAALHGPSYETPAEIRALRALGADAVGMSTVPEAIVARHMGLEVLGLSCLSNMAAGVRPTPLSHEEVFETARRVSGPFAALLTAIIERL